VKFVIHLTSSLLLGKAAPAVNRVYIKFEVFEKSYNENASKIEIIDFFTMPTIIA
jgi:hypothetical protein